MIGNAILIIAFISVVVFIMDTIVQTCGFSPDRIEGEDYIVKVEYEDLQRISKLAGAEIVIDNAIHDLLEKEAEIEQDQRTWWNRMEKKYDLSEEKKHVNFATGEIRKGHKNK